MKERLFVIASQRSIGKTWWMVGEKAGPAPEVRQDVEFSNQSRGHAFDRNAWPPGRGPRTTAISCSNDPCSDRSTQSMCPSHTSPRHVVLIAFTKVSSAGLRPAGPVGGLPSGRPSSPAERVRRLARSDCSNRPVPQETEAALQPDIPLLSLREPNSVSSQPYQLPERP